MSPGFAQDRTLLASATWTGSSLFMSQDGGLTWRAIFPPGGPYCGNSTFGTIYPQFSPDFPEDPTIYAATYRGRPVCQLRCGCKLDHAGASTPPTIWPCAVRRRQTPPLGAHQAQGSPDLPEDVHQVFLPLAAVQGSGPPYKPHTLFMEAHSVTQRCGILPLRRRRPAPGSA
ncbi:MAG: hypothetical protein V9H69_17705 [Anaerolineae bacterium]